MRLPGAVFGPPQDRCKPPPLHQDLNLIPSSAHRFHRSIRDCAGCRKHGHAEHERYRQWHADL